MTVPKKNLRTVSVLFECHHLYYLPNFIPIIDEMCKRGHYHITASIPHSVNSEEQKIFQRTCANIGIPTISRIDETSRLAALNQAEFDVVVVGNIGKLHSIIHDTSLAVMVYHGIGMKQTYYRDIDDRIDLRAVESQVRLEELQNRGYTNLVLVGFTKCDPLVNISSDQWEKLDQMGLDPRRKTVLFAPTFYPSSQEKLLPYLENLSYEFNLIIKLHSFSWHQQRYLSQSEKMKQVTNEHKNTFLVPADEYDIIPYYKLADLLVSDISSTIYEFLALDRPIIMAECFTLRLKHRLFNRRFQRRLDFERMESVDFAYRLVNPADVLSLTYHALEHPEEMRSQRQKALEEYLYKGDGKASWRLVNAIEQRLGQK